MTNAADLIEESRQRVRENWQRIVAEVSVAASLSGRSTDDVQIVGVTKYVDAKITEHLIEAGCKDLGESRPQQLCEKAAIVSNADARWHMIGHLQRNKAKRVVEIAHMIHSVDSLKLLETIETNGHQVGRSPKLLLEVNISGDAAKHGFASDDLLRDWPQAACRIGLSIVGLMTMAGLESSADDTRREFAALRMLRDTICVRYQASLPELSMGMSGDFAAAIAEGATIVRIGSRLFEGVV